MNVKICGLSEPETLGAAITAGARYVGFVFFPKSPRNVTPQIAARLAAEVPPGVCKVALTVNASDETLDDILATAPIDMIQLHGTESPERLRDIKTRYGLPVMKAIGIADADDLAQIPEYERVADQILVDTKPPRGADRPGGNGESFDWALVAQRRWAVPWMLAGGLTKDNVQSAIAQTGAQQIDLSSAVESAPGVKDPDMIKAFLKEALRTPAPRI